MRTLFFYGIVTIVLHPCYIEMKSDTESFRGCLPSGGPKPADLQAGAMINCRFCISLQTPVTFARSGPIRETQRPKTVQHNHEA